MYTLISEATIHKIFVCVPVTEHKRLRIYFSEQLQVIVDIHQSPGNNRYSPRANYKQSIIIISVSDERRTVVTNYPLSRISVDARSS